MDYSESEPDFFDIEIDQFNNNNELSISLFQ